MEIPFPIGCSIVAALTSPWLSIVRTNAVGRWTRWHIQCSKADGPIEINLDTVKALGLMIPQPVLLRACEVIE